MNGVNPAKINAVTSAAAAAPTDASELNNSFKNILSDAITKVHESQAKADEAIKQLSEGNTDNLHQVMIALEEANIVLQYTVQLRNKVVEAYQEIMRMQM
jgi:flagellar hook-basal body complex protein FliE